MDERQIRNKNAVERAKKMLEKREPTDLSYKGRVSRATRASEIIANQPIVQEIVARQLGIKK